MSIILRLFDLMSTMCYQPYKSLTDDDMAKAKRIVDLFQEMWRKMYKWVPPKVHMWDHLLQNLELTRGMKFHTENPIEQEHQIGVRLERRFGNTRSGEKKFGNMLQARANLRMPAVLEKKAEVSKTSKRKMKNPRTQSGNESNPPLTSWNWKLEDSRRSYLSKIQR